LIKIKSWFFLSEARLPAKGRLALPKTMLVSLYLQSNEANILNVASHVDDTKNKLQALNLV